MKAPKRGWKIAIIFWIIGLLCVAGFVILVIEGSWIAIICLAFAGAAFVYPCCEDKPKDKAEKPLTPDDEIAKVKILGTRTGEETRVLGTYNFTVYSFLIEYKSGRREVKECTKDSKEFQELISRADMDEK